jgi:hypothetical protein
MRLFVGPRPADLAGRRAPFGALALGALLLACSSSSSGPSGEDCSSDPSICAAGTTCWPVDDVPNLRCIQSSAGGTFGQACQLTPGKATCGDGLACDQTGPLGGSCVPYCGSQLPPCPSGFDCHTTHVGSANGPAIELCRPAGPGDDAGIGDPGGDDASSTLDWDGEAGTTVHQ